MHIIRVYRLGAWRGPIATFRGLDAETELRKSSFFNDSSCVILR